MKGQMTSIKQGDNAKAEPKNVKNIILTPFFYKTFVKNLAT